MRLSNVTVTEAERLYKAALESYRDLFGPMDRAARSLWFLTMDEFEILSFPVLAGQDPQEASVRHGVKLAAMADALESLPDHEEWVHEANDLRRIARQHGYLGR